MNSTQGSKTSSCTGQNTAAASQGTSMGLLPIGTPNQPLMGTMHTPQHPSGPIFSSVTLDSLQMIAGEPQGRPVQSPSILTQDQPSTPATPQHPPQAPRYYVRIPDYQQLTGTASDSTAYQLRNSGFSVPQGVVGATAHNSQMPVEDALQKRELRLMKNREAARECRRKKKEYVKCLENRVAVLENQNKTLIEELRALKDIYRRKAEEAARRCRERKKAYMASLHRGINSMVQENQKLKAQLYLHNNQGTKELDLDPSKKP